MFHEHQRKLFHCLAIAFPIIYYFISYPQMIATLTIINLIALSIDLSRRYKTNIQDLVVKIFGNIIRQHELNSLSGLSYMALGFLITAIFFKKNIVILSWLVLIICDPVAGLYGQHFGKKTKWGKSLAGSYAFIACAFLVCLMGVSFFGLYINFLKMLAAICITALAEFYSKLLKIDDNLLIPLIFCIISSL